MPERRRAHRFALSEGTRAMLRWMDDVYIECSDAAETTVIAAQPVSIGEEVLLELPSNATRRAVTLTKAVRRTLVPYGGTMRHRVVLRRLHACSHHSAFATADERVTHAARMAVLVRRLPVSLAEVSTTGCRLESAQALLTGTVGILVLPTDAEPAGEPLRISRCTRTPGGAAAYRLGAEFLSLDAPAPTSLRNSVARLEIVMELTSLDPRTSSWPAQSAGGAERADATEMLATQWNLIGEEPTV
jgi:hypothetical protein